MTFGIDIDSKEKSVVENFDSYHISEITSYGPIDEYKEQSDNVKSKDIESITATTQSLDGPMDSPWPMYCHDARHTGRSPYSTVDTWDEILWTIKTYGSAGGGPVIDQNGIIYIGSHDLRAVYPNGTLKWTFNLDGWCQGTAPAIDENGTIYVGTTYGYFYAINPDGTKKWKIKKTSSIWSSPAIGEDGTIYIGNSDNWNIEALYPNNGTVKWAYKTGLVVYSAPAIGQDGTIYCGSHDNYLYALYPNNGTLKWKYGTGNWIRTSPCIGDDGTIYFVSLDGYLRAIYPNGTLKWQTSVGGGTSPTIGQDGTIYAGYSTLYAVNPDGSVKWTFDQGGTMQGGTPCNSIDGTIYVGTSEGGELIAINPDGTLKWRKGIGKCESAPAIGEDGTLYIGSNNDRLYAFGRGELEADANGPYYGLINQPVQFTGTSSGGYSPHSYHWDFGDTYTSDEQNPIHTYTNSGNYDVVLIVTDNEQNTAVDTTFAWVQTSNTAPNKPAINGPTSGNAGTSYDYTFSATDPDGSSIYYYVDWGDSSNSGWLGPYDSDETITESHTWSGQGTFTISAKAKDPYNEEGPWGEFSVNMKVRNRAYSNTLLLRLLERFPFLERLFNLIL